MYRGRGRAGTSGDVERCGHKVIMIKCRKWSSGRGARTTRLNEGSSARYRVKKVGRAVVGPLVTHLPLLSPHQHLRAGVPKCWSRSLLHKTLQCILEIPSSRRIEIMVVYGILITIGPAQRG